ncbi:MAG: nickel-dependent lactate racemase [Chloroflexi bacterium]|nr:MAG: nickel-dependent lactate racemase [Chloroflexota bacterium]
MMRIKLAYGKEGLWVTLPDEARVTVLEPKFVPGLPDEQAAIREALRQPVGTPPLRELVRPEDTVAIAFSDLTRPMPSDRVLPVLLEELAHVPRENITLFNAVGTHRPNTPEELVSILGREVAEGYRVVQHNAFDPDGLVLLGETSFGHEMWINRDFMAASVKILTGFIEPHLFAGFSGGPKAVLPGLAGERTILGNHGPQMIEHPQATWGITQGNPIWEEMHEVALRVQPTFLLNVTLNKAREITGVFAGDMDQAHAAGAEFVRQSAMTPVLAPFDIVITSNSGYPLDLNLYQAVKGMSAAAQIVRQGGSIILAAECVDGIPDHGEYKRLLQMADNPQQLLDIVTAPGFVCIDQWEAQLQAMIQLKADVYVKASYLSDEQIRQALLIPSPDVEATLWDLLRKYGPQATICVLPEGPQTIPYIE